MKPPKSNPSRPLPLSRRLATIIEETEDERLSFTQLAAKLHSRAWGGLLFIFAAINVLPLPPGTSVFFAIPLMIVSAQMVLGRASPWFPTRIDRRGVKKSELERLIAKISGFETRIERVLKPRLGSLTGPTATRIIGIVCFLLALLAAIPIPLFHMAPAAAILLFGLALIYRDGALVIVAAVAAVLSLAVDAALVGSGVAPLSYLIPGFIARRTTRRRQRTLHRRFTAVRARAKNDSLSPPPARRDVTMRIRSVIAALALGTAAVGLTACAEQINTTVSRYQAMPAPQGQTFFVEPAGGMAANGGLEFQRYAGLVAQQLQARGFQPASSPQSANMIVQFGYGVDHGQTRVRRGSLLPQPLVTAGSAGAPASSIARASDGAAVGMGLGRPLLVRRRSQFLCRISQPDRPPHPRLRHQRPAVRRPRPGAFGDQPARRRHPEPGRRDVHRLSGAQRRSDEDHDPDAAAGPLVSQLQI